MVIPSHPRVTVTNLGEGVNSPYDDYAPLVLSASHYLLFTSNRPTPQGEDHGDDFWSSERAHGPFMKAMNLEKLNTDKDEGSACFSPDGSGVYFVQCWTEDGLGDADIYSASVVNGRWEKIKNLGRDINTKYWDSMPFISPDGSELYFSSDRPGGYGGTDIYVTKLRNGGWSEPKNLGQEINTSDDEKSPILSPDGEQLYFSSNGRGGVGGFDIYVSKLVRKKWTTPKNAGTPINSPADELYFSLSAQEDTIFISSRREGGYGGLDLWAADHNPFKDTTRYEFYVAGRVIDTLTTRGVSSATIIVGNKSLGETSTITSGANGQYRFKTNLGTNYIFQVTATGYHPNTLAVSIPKVLSYQEYRRNIPLTPIIVEKPETTVVPHIVYFDFDKSYIRTDAVVVLDSVIYRAQQYVKGEVYLDAHTDERGTEAYNIELSRKRGASVSKYLSDHGVQVEWISMTPHGESIPVDSNETDDGRQHNRRVEVRITGKRSPQP